MKELTVRQKEVLSFIADYKNKHSYPPTIREIAEHFSMSVKGAHDHITALKKKGQIKHEDKRPRTLELTNSKKEDHSSMIDVPLLGNVAAGVPLLAEENFERNIPIHSSFLKKNKKYFALRVKGDSMSGAGILDGDFAIIEKQSVVHNGEIAVALLDDGVTLKRFFNEGARIKLQPENPAYRAKHYTKDVKILGRLTGVIRSY